MNEAATARANAMDMEVKKDGLAQQQSGAWVFKLKVHPEDMHTAIMQAPMGTRYKCVLVELNDDETPVVQPKEPKKTNYAQQAGIMCNQAGFHVYLARQRCVHFKGGSSHVEFREIAATFIREHCGVKSRSDLGRLQESTEISRLKKCPPHKGAG